MIYYGGAGAVLNIDSGLEIKSIVLTKYLDTYDEHGNKLEWRPKLNVHCIAVTDYDAEDDKYLIEQVIDIMSARLDHSDNPYVSDFNGEVAAELIDSNRQKLYVVVNTEFVGYGTHTVGNVTTNHYSTTSFVEPVHVRYGFDDMVVHGRRKITK